MIIVSIVSLSLSTKLIGFGKYEFCASSECVEFLDVDFVHLLEIQRIAAEQTCIDINITSPTN